MPFNSSQRKSAVLSYARSLGFERVGIAPARALDEAGRRLESWLRFGRQGDMAYMARQPSRRARPAEQLPEARSIVALAMNYYPGEPPPGNEGRISRYAWGRDYHRLIGKRLESLVRYLEALAPGTRCRTFVDAGPLLERAFAREAGLGFVGKNTMLITRGLGSWVFLAHVVTTLDLPPDAPDERSCGTCRLCLDACPTGAIVAPYELDARRCTAYLTIESSAAVPADLRARMEGWIFGCDICQEVCPHNTRVPLTGETAFHPKAEPAAPPGLREILGMDEEAFRRRFQGTALARAGRAGLVRNACIAAAHLKREDLRGALERLDRDGEDETIREHARWALGRMTARPDLFPLN